MHVLMLFLYQLSFRSKQTLLDHIRYFLIDLSKFYLGVTFCDNSIVIVFFVKKGNPPPPEKGCIYK